jgi:hypothetical protein
LDPKDRAALFVKLLEYVIPKQRQVEIETNQKIEAINVVFETTGIRPIHNESDFLDD